MILTKNLTRCPVIDLDWFEVPAGAFLMGSDKTSDNPSREESIEAFLISKHPVTNAQYAQFLEACPEWRKDVAPDELVDADYLSDWDGDNFPAGQEQFPVAWISWHAGVAFCEWASTVLNKKVLLPSERQWEKACRGTEGNLFAWGNEIAEGRANYCSQSAPVERTVDGRIANGKFSPHGDSPYGCVDMCGNVWEWCADWFDEHEDERVLRGGGWNFTAEFLMAPFRFSCEPTTAYNYIGFRCASTPD